MIWSKQSVKSRFVRDEARFALFYNKLVAVKTNDLDIMEVPFGFQSQHTDWLNDPENVCSALKKLGVLAIARATGGLTAQALKTATNPQALIDFIASESDGATRDLLQRQKGSSLIGQTRRVDVGR